MLTQVSLTLGKSASHLGFVQADKARRLKVKELPLPLVFVGEKGKQSWCPFPAVPQQLLPCELSHFCSFLSTEQNPPCKELLTLLSLAGFPAPLIPVE